jgi:riboflavin kinase/FMN adenylyltransferase
LGGVISMADIIYPEEASSARFDDSVVTIGVFDGVHVGHRKVVETLSRRKNEISAARSVLVTFDRHPMSVTRPGSEPPLLTTMPEKLSILRSLDVDVIIVDRFDLETAHTGYRDFIRRMLSERLGMRHLVIGYDFHLGKDRTGDQKHLACEGAGMGFGVTVVPPVVVGGAAVSSTRIRKDVSERNLHRAARLLERPYFIDASVVSGDGFGRTIGFPTANLDIEDSSKLVPPRGAYAVEVETGGKRYGGMMNIGSAPTVRKSGPGRVEIHLLDFSGDLYGCGIRVHCLEYFREEKAFPDSAGLREQLLQDRERVRGILEKKC